MSDSNEMSETWATGCTHAKIADATTQPVNNHPQYQCSTEVVERRNELGEIKDIEVFLSLLADFHTAVDERVTMIIEKLGRPKEKEAAEVQDSATLGDAGSTARKRPRDDGDSQDAGLNQAEAASDASNMHKKRKGKALFMTLCRCKICSRLLGRAKFD